MFGIVISMYASGASPAYAGLFDSVLNIFSSKEEPVLIQENSQNMSLLRSALNSNQYQGRGGGEIAIDDHALVAPVGPTVAAANDSDDVYLKEARISIYVVHQGDSIGAIAKMYDVSVNTIRWANDIPANGNITPGQTLLILPINGVQHTVKKGETLGSLAKKYKGDADEIASFNDIPSGTGLTVGETIIIPDGVEEAVAPRPSTNNRAPAGRLTTSGGQNIPGYFTWPVDGGTRTQGLHGHNGVDIGAPRGTTVFAAAPGLVIISRDGWNGGYGRMIVINHPNGTQTLYSHLSASHVSSGQYVTAGQSIGAVGSTGRSTGPHLHFEVHGAANPFTK